MTSTFARLAAAVLFVTLLSSPGFAQRSWQTPSGTDASGTVAMCLNGSNKAVPCSAAVPLQVTGGGGGGGGTSDATAANQTSQITQETAINTVLGAKTDAKSTATDGTSISFMQVMKQISASVQAPPAGTGAATSALQSTIDGHVDGLEGQLTTLDGRVDGLETLIGSTNTAIAALPQNNSLAAGTTGGCTLGKTLSAATTNATSVKGSAGTLCSLTVINTTATIYFLKFYDKATAATCNSDAVLQTIPIPASTTGAGVAVSVGPYGWAFPTGITFCLTGSMADNDNTSADIGVAINYSYK